MHKAVLVALVFGGGFVSAQLNLFTRLRTNLAALPGASAKGSLGLAIGLLTLCFAVLVLLPVVVGAASAVRDGKCVPVRSEHSLAVQAAVVSLRRRGSF